MSAAETTTEEESNPSEPPRARVSVVVRGQVQGVGFRPFVSALAHKLSLGGLVRNDVDGVSVEVEGGEEDVNHFLEVLKQSPPPLARIEGMDLTPVPPLGEHAFRIEASYESDGLQASSLDKSAFVTPDTATCDDCLSELFDPKNRRFRHPFINCTNCGPRLTIVNAVPYDRERTTMASFEMCSDCRGEYDDQSNAARRFHAQPIACPKCGPQLELVRSDGSAVAITDGDPLAVAARAILEGAIVAIKGLGGYHIACDARDDVAVSELRRAKDRDAKPFALLVSSIEDARKLCDISEEEEALLLDPTRPIVLLQRAQEESGRPVAPSVAPGQGRLGVMLPYTPIHHLLVRECGGIPLVMTSGNVTDEPIAYTDEDAITRLGPLVDWVLRHNRPIETRVEDSIAHVIDGVPVLLRRSRGYAPAPLVLPLPLAKPTLALGGHLKSVFALGLGTRAFASPHFGDLDHYEAVCSYRETLDHYKRLLRLEPACVVHDLHPDYATTQIAIELESVCQIERIAVQHHETHVASCFAESIDPDRRAIGVAFDGAGWGRDGTIWGGELFVGSLVSGLTRRARLRPVAMPGGDRAAREPWRMAVSYLLDAGIEPTLDRVALSTTNITAQDIESVAQLSENTSLTIQTSSVGRLFDAAAALIGVRTRSKYEAQAAMELQTIAEKRLVSTSPRAGERDDGYEFDLHHRKGGLLEIDTRPLIDGIADDVCGAQSESDAISMCFGFHVTLANMIASACEELRKEDPTLEHVGLTGGVFANALLVDLTLTRLRARGFLPFVQREVPTNDGGLAYGQLALAASAMLMRGVS